MIVGPVVTVIWYFWPPVDIYEGGPAFIAALAAIVVVSLFTRPPEDDDFDKLWDDFTEKNELGRFSFLPSDEQVIENLKASNLDNKTEKEIIMDLIDRDYKSAGTFRTTGTAETNG